MSREQFTVNGTLIKVWAGQKSVLPKRRHRRRGATPRWMLTPVHSEALLPIHCERLAGRDQMGQMKLPEFEEESSR